MTTTQNHLKSSIAAATHRADRKRFEQVIERYLRHCYAQRSVARVSELAQLLDASRSYLSRVVPQLFGASLGDLLREKQLSEARRLLRVTPLGLDDIAAASGFGHRSTLFRRFRARFAITPAQYRRSQKAR